MTPEEAIEILDNEYKRIELQIMSLKGTIKENTESFRYRIDVKESLKTAITALKEIQLYKDNKLCLVPTDVYSRQCSELDAYKEIGTVEECQEAVEKQKAKKPRLNYKPKFFGRATYTCPRCGNCCLEEFANERQNNRYCWDCGQKIDFGGCV